MFKEGFFTRKINFILPLMAVLLLSGCSNKSLLKSDQAFEPETSINEANRLIKDGENEEARKVLEDVIAKDSTLRYSSIARLRIADTHFEEGSYDEAVAEYEAFLDSQPYHSYAPYAQYRIAMSYFSRIRTIDVSYPWAKKSIEEFQELMQRYPRNPYMDAAENRIKMCKRILAEYEFYVGNFYFKKESYKAAANRFEGILKSYPESKNEPEALYYLALSYENMGEKDQAIRTLSSLIDKYPTTSIANNARELISTLNDQK